MQKVLKKGANEHLFRPGDIVVELNGKLLNSFVDFEAEIDKGLAVGSVTVTLDRGGVAVTVEPKVVDLNALTPTSFLDVGGGVLHGLPYTSALLEGVPLDAVVVSRVGYMLEQASMTRNTIIASINGVVTPTVDACADVLRTLADGAHFTVTMKHVIDQRYQYSDVIAMDRTFFPMCLWRRDVLADIKRTDVLSEVRTLTHMISGCHCFLMLLLARRCGPVKISRHPHLQLHG